jgi:aminoglycoside phosphotransferase (APT) family kinase protein
MYEEQRPDRPPRVEWVERSRPFRAWLAAGPIDAEAVSLGIEGETLILSRDGSPAYVIKRWNRVIPADARAHHAFLGQALAAGLPVPDPAGWGVDGEGNQVLATRFAGHPMAQPSDADIADCARILARIHASQPDRFHLEGPPPGEDPMDHLIPRHFPKPTEHPDLAGLLARLKEGVTRLRPAMVHGDFNLGNVMDLGGRKTVIDWWLRLGDHRYDAAWASTLLWIYETERAREVFIETYDARARSPLAEEWRTFEAMAALNWIVLDRTVGAPDGALLCDRATAFARWRLPDGLRHALGPHHRHPQGT